MDRVAVDMGGTTAKASLITNSELEIREGYFIGGYASGQPMQLPVADIVEVGAGDRVSFLTAGGGGYGNPLDRPALAVERDLAQGFITPAAATRDYGQAAPGDNDQAREKAREKANEEASEQ